MSGAQNKRTNMMLAQRRYIEFDEIRAPNAVVRRPRAGIMTIGGISRLTSGLRGESPCGCAFTTIPKHSCRIGKTVTSDTLCQSINAKWIFTM